MTLALRVRENIVEGMRTLNIHVVRNASVSACIPRVFVETGTVRDPSFEVWFLGFRNSEIVSLASMTENVIDVIAIISATTKRTAEVDIISELTSVGLDRSLLSKEHHRAYRTGSS